MYRHCTHVQILIAHVCTDTAHTVQTLHTRVQTLGMKMDVTLHRLRDPRGVTKLATALVSGWKDRSRRKPDAPVTHTEKVTNMSVK